MTLTITISAQSSLPVDWHSFTPDWARDKPLKEIERLQILHGSQKLPLGELFQVRGKADDGRWELQGDYSRVHEIGAGMTSGGIRISNSAGRHVGSQMQGGEIHVEGNAGDFVGAEMHGGFIHVQGSAGNSVGAARRGSPRGMTGGTILIDGDCGDEVGAAMRRGLIAIGGNAGDFVGHSMLAGTVFVLGECGAHPGTGMRRGTLVLAAANRSALPRGYQFACVSQPPVLPLLFNELRQRGFRLHPYSQCDTYNGDMLSGGRGEILLCRTA